MLPPRQRKRIDDAIVAERTLADTRQLGVDEHHVEGCVVRDEIGIAEKFDQFVGDVREQRLVFQERVVSPCTRAASIDIGRSGLR